MATEALLVALTESSPTGADLSFSSDFDRIQEMRRADDPTLSQGEWVTELKSADWPGVASACEALLAEKTKDLRVAGWLLEAWCKLRGYAGLADGLDLAHGLCAAFWADLHPQPDDGDFELRIGALSRLLLQVVQQAPALALLHHQERAFSLNDIQSARLLAASIAKSTNPDKIATAGKVTVDDITKAQRATPVASLGTAADECRRAIDALAALQAVVDAHLGADGPSFAPAREALEDVLRSVEKLHREAGGAPGSAASALADDSGTAGTAAFSGGAPATRAQALAQLRQVAAFFRATEPHSPVAYLAERAAHWGELPLHEWLRLVVKDGGTLSQLEELLAIPPRGDG